jgi:NAD kinase
MPFEKIVLVTRKTRLEGLVEKYNTRPQARFYINQSARHRGEESRDAFAFYQQEHDVYYRATERLQNELQRLLKVQTVERAFLPNFLFTESDLVVTVGVDGLVVNTAKYLHGQPVIAVNPDPEHIDGILLPYTVDQAAGAVSKALAGTQHIRSVSMAEARLNDGQTLLAFNDLFIGVSNHTSARYAIRWAGKLENHSSSGVIVSTGAGSTGWLSSMFNMANGIALGFGSGSPVAPPKLAWDANKLVFVVREPFVSRTSGAEIVCGEISAEAPLTLESLMPEKGVIFSDGVDADFLQFNSGSTATIGLSARRTNLFVG